MLLRLRLPGLCIRVMTRSTPLPRSRNLVVLDQGSVTKSRFERHVASVRASREYRDDRAPDFLTVEEAAAVLRIGRSKAYELAREYLATDGASGMPVIRLGKQLRVPRALLECWMGGPITWPIVNNRSPAASPVVSIASTTHRSRPNRRNASTSQQTSIPFSV
jgi:excisionase family DNA binding protein